MFDPALPRPGAVLETLYARALARPDELGLAAQALYGRGPTDEELPYLLDFFATEWVDSEGLVEAERAVAEGQVPAEVARWPAEVRCGLWVVDRYRDGLAELRDVGSDEEIAVAAPGLGDDLTPRTVLRARLLPWGGTWFFSGSPDLYGPMGVIARMDLLSAWRQEPEAVLGPALRTLRQRFRQQREEREAWIAFFGSDLVVFDDADALATALEGLAPFLTDTWRFASLGGRTRREVWRNTHPTEAPALELRVGASLQGPGRPGAIYDAVEGVHFLPRLGELLDHLRGVADHSQVVLDALADPGVTALPFVRAGQTAALARLLGVGDAPIETLLAPHKEQVRRPPSVLPGFEDSPG